MTWNIAGKRWFKKFRGKMYAISPRQLHRPPNREESRLAANDWWKAKEREIEDKDKATQKAIIEENLRQFLEIEENLKEKAGELVPSSFPSSVTLTDKPLYVWQLQATVPNDKRLTRNVERWIDGKLSRHKAGEVSAGRFQNWRIEIEQFQTFVRTKSPLDDVSLIDGRLLEQYQLHLLEKIGNGEFAPPSAKSRLDIAKQFARWLFGQGLIELPNNIINPKDLTIKVPTTKNEAYPIEIIKTILADDATPERTKLYILLMLNGGMYQVDIAHLTHEQFDLENGRITRKRTKTADYENVPTVNYLLWQRTKELLVKHRANGGEWLLLNENGLCLQREEIKANKHLKKVCNITTAYARLKARLDITQPLKLLRKTSSNLLYNEKQFRPLHTLFLGHSPRSVAEKFYVNPEDNTLDDAIRWLGEQYGIK